MMKYYNRSQVREASNLWPNSTQLQSYATTVADLLRDNSQPLRIGELVARLLDLGFSGRSLEDNVRQTLGRLYQAVPVAYEQYGWLSNLLDGIAIRHPLANDEARRGFMFMDELEHAALFPQFFQAHRPDQRVVTIDLWGGATITAKAFIEKRTWSLLLGDEFVEWVELLGGQGGDSVIMMVEDAAAGKYTFRLQPHEARDDYAIQSRNIHLSLAAEEILREEHGSREAMPAWELAARLIGRGLYEDVTPPDDLHCVLHQYSTLSFNSDAGYSLVPQSEKMMRPFTDLSDRTFDPIYDVPAAKNSTREGWSEANEETTELEICVDLLAEKDDEEYDSYLENLYLFGGGDIPLTKAEYNILKAELKSLITLEKRYGHLVTQQQERVDYLCDQLFVDVDSLEDDGDFSSHMDYGGAIF